MSRILEDLHVLNKDHLGAVDIFTSSLLKVNRMFFFWGGGEVSLFLDASADPLSQNVTSC